VTPKTPSDQMMNGEEPTNEENLNEKRALPSDVEQVDGDTKKQKVMETTITTDENVSQNAQEVVVA